MRLAEEHQNTTVMVEKAVDVMLAVDLVVMAERNEFDVAYLLSADGDYTPAVEHVRTLGKQVYGVWFSCWTIQAESHTTGCGTNA